MKKITTLCLTLFTVSAFANTTYTCKAKSGKAIELEVSSSVAYLGEELFVRDINYNFVSQNSKYYKYTNEGAELLVPRLLAKDKVNVANVVMFKPGKKTIFNCMK